VDLYCLNHDSQDLTITMTTANHQILSFVTFPLKYPVAFIYS